MTNEVRKKFLTLHAAWMQKIRYRDMIEKLAAGYEESVMEGDKTSFESAAKALLCDIL